MEAVFLECCKYAFDTALIVLNLAADCCFMFPTKLCKKILLLEVETDDTLRLMFGDSGLMYVFIDSTKLVRWRQTGSVDEKDLLVSWDWF